MDDRNENLTPSPEEVEQVTPETKAVEEPQVKFETEGSTIFVKHEYNTKKPSKNGWKKRIGIAAISLLLCVCIAVSVFLVVKLVPTPDSGTESMPSAASQEAIPVISIKTEGENTGVILGADTVLTKGVEIKTAGIYNFYENYTIDSYEDDKGAKKWHILGIDKDQTLSDELDSHVKKCLNITAIAKMENTYSSVEAYHNAYGLNDEECTRAFLALIDDGTEEGYEIEILVGMQTASKDSNYLKVSGDDTVYIVSSSYIMYYDYLPKDFADLNMLNKIEETKDNGDYFTTGKLSRFDYINISGGVLNGKSYKFGMSTDVSADYMPYVMLSPYRRPASEKFLENILEFASNGIQADGLYTFNATAENKEKCGMNDPSCVIEVKIDDYYFKLTIGGLMQEGNTGLSAMINGKKQIFMIDAKTLDFIDPDITSMFNYNFIMENIYEVESLTFKNETGTHTFKLKHTPMDNNPNAFTTAVTYKGKNVSDTSFKALYQRVLLLSLLSFVIEEEKTEPILTVTFEYSGDYKDRVVEFTQSPRDNYHYVAWIDGVPLGEVLKASVTDITTNLSNYVAGGAVPAP